MGIAAFDTMAYVKKLEDAGVDRKQAEAQAEALFQIVSDQLATKQDLKELELRLRYDLTVRLGGIVVACTAILLAFLPMIIKP